MIDQHSNCDTYEPLISAMIDGELESDERNELNSHLQNCTTCKQRVIAFERVDAAVETLSHNSEPTQSTNEAILRLQSAVPFAMYPPKKVPPRANNLLIWRLIPLAAAATLLICLGVAAWPSASAESISPAQIVEPMKELHLLNLEKQREQSLMLRTLIMDLRSMKLEINMFEPGSAERVSFASQIDAMIEKVELYETNEGE